MLPLGLTLGSRRGGRNRAPRRARGPVTCTSFGSMRVRQGTVIVQRTRSGFDFGRSERSYAIDIPARRSHLVRDVLRLLDAPWTRRGQPPSLSGKNASWDL